MEVVKTDRAKFPAVTAVKSRRVFLRWILINVLFLLGLGTAVVMYDGNIPMVAQVVCGAVMVVFAYGSIYAGKLSWYEQPDRKGTISWVEEKCTGLAMLGFIAGLLIALGGDQSTTAATFQQRVLGAMSGVAATFVGISCWLVLSLLQKPLQEHADE